MIREQPQIQGQQAILGKQVQPEQMVLQVLQEIQEQLGHKVFLGQLQIQVLLVGQILLVHQVLQDILAIQVIKEKQEQQERTGPTENTYLQGIPLLAIITGATCRTDLTGATGVTKNTGVPG